MKRQNFAASEIIILAALLSHVGFCFSAVAENRTGIGADVDDPKLIVYSGTATTVTVQSLSTNVAVEIRSPVEPLSGVACDAWNENVYWAADQFPAKFYQAKFDGSEIGSALANSFDWTSGVDKIAVDWITGNLYVAGWTWDIGGISPTYIAVCDPEGTHCVRIAEGFEAYSLVLDPNEGVMYWTTVTQTGIWMAGMDGSLPEKLVDLENPAGLAVDLEASRFYWIDQDYKSIRTSDMDGSNQRNVLAFERGEIAGEIAIHGGRIYYSLVKNSGSYVYSVPTTGEGEPLLHYYNEIQAFNPGIAVSAKENQPKVRNNDCAGDPCSHVCVLARTSGYKCVCPKGANLGSDGKTCEEEGSESLRKLMR